jgi:hypothetical protein
MVGRLIHLKNMNFFLKKRICYLIMFDARLFILSLKTVLYDLS